MSCLAANAWAAPGSRPRNVVVTSDGAYALSTSLGSTAVMETDLRGSTPVTRSIDVGAATWGICLVGTSWAVVTHPDQEYLSVLVRNPLTGAFAHDPSRRIQGVPRFCTEVVAVPGAPRVLVANRGAMPAGADPGTESWVHAVYEYTLPKSGNAASLVRTFLTEREPRSLALSPDGSRLYVGTVMGALGGAGLVASVDHPHFDEFHTFDGGGILSYRRDVPGTLQRPVDRFEVGSPVRGMVVLGGLAFGQYRLYFSHVGSGAQSEDPGFGGRQIPNVLSNLLFSATHVPVQRQDAVFGHQVEFDPFVPPAGQLPAVLHEKLCLRRITTGTESILELWVSNSGSGTVSRAPLGQDGSFRLLSGSPVAVTVQELTRVGTELISTNHVYEYPVLGIQGAGGFQYHADVSDDLTADGRFTSAPAGIAYDAVHDAVLTVTELGHELLGLKAQSSGVIELAHRTTFEQADLQDSAVRAERNFFSFGRGFRFREDVPADRVATLTCGTCHPSGHLDGKVRFTVRRGENLPEGMAPDKPVAVPSVLDIGSTEWIFFEGTRTTLDAEPRHANEDDICNYCDVVEFFLDTAAFTGAVATPRAPGVATTGRLRQDQLNGRFRFESMNCVRCHGGPMEVFQRSNDPALLGGDPISNLGPLPLDLVVSNRFLHDASQVFITDTGTVSGGGGGGGAGGGNLKVEEPPIGDQVSRRNMTDVGTRPVGDGLRNGINTPALAGAWDNGPYMHDGRYRTLQEVLENTWLDVNDGYLAAPWYEGFADNALNNDAFEPVEGTDLPNAVGPLHQFGTHRHADGGAGRISVAQHLQSMGPSASQELLAFLTAVSSQTEPCGPGADESALFSPVAINLGPGCTSASLQWTTAVEMSCRVEWGQVGQPATLIHTQPGRVHAVTLPVTPGADYYLRAQIHTVCGQKIGPDVQFTATGCSPPLPKGTQLSTGIQQISPNPAADQTTIHFALSQRGEVELKVYNVAGRLVRTVEDGTLDRGNYVRRWNGESHHGGRVAAGTYFLVFQAGQHTERHKLVVLR